MSSFQVAWAEDESGKYFHPIENPEEVTIGTGDVIGTVYHPNYGSCFVVLPYYRSRPWDKAHDAITVPVYACTVTKKD